MRSGTRVLRYAVLAGVILFIVYRMSTQTVDISSYMPAMDSGSGSSGEVDHSLDHLMDHSMDHSMDHKSPVSGLPGTSSVNMPYQKANATFVTLARNQDLQELLSSIRAIEDRFNHNYHYDWVFLNDAPFDEEFKKMTSRLVSGTTHYGLIGPEHWGFPDWIDQDRAARTREEMKAKGIIYGDSVSYRHMCRYESGFFWRHPIMDAYQYYWRVEPSVKIHCDIPYDLFKYMEEKGKKYAFVISLYEYIDTIPTLWETTKEFLKKFPHFQAADSMMDFISDDGGETYNKCHFWSNFEIASLDLWRGEAYRAYFDHLDQAGGFFYERWGDAPVHSIAASLFLNKSEIHYFDDVGYWHVPFSNCPTDVAIREDRNCMCFPEDNFTWNGYSCTPRYYKSKSLERPPGWEEQPQ